MSWTLSLATLVEAAMRSGQEHLAAGALQRLRERAEVAGTHWAEGLIARATAADARHGLPLP